ncbi:Rho GTPase activation protein [Lactarius hengduanensis]|nr:Rho GTPase activation protein [Lactarius hengduanensis]
MRAENLGEGYDCLEELVFTPTIKDVLIKYMDGMITACTKYDDLAISIRADVGRALAGTDTSDLRASFCRAFAFSIPPPTLYRNNRPGAYSDLIFGIPLVDLTTNEDNVPKVMRMCIEEVEKRGLNTKGIYCASRSRRVLGFMNIVTEVLETSGIHPMNDLLANVNSHPVAAERYLWDLPEPIFMLSLQDYKNYRQNRARYTESLFSLVQSKFRQLHPVHRASLGALLRHLLRVASHSDKNAMTVNALAVKFWYPVLRGNEVLQQDGVHVKVLVMEDLIRNAHNLFDEHPSPSPPVPSSDLAETSSIHAYGSLFLSPELPRPPEVQAMGPTTRRHPGLADGNPTSNESRFTPSPGPLLNPLLGLSSSQTLTEGAEMTTQEQAVSEVRGTKAVVTLLNSTPSRLPHPHTQKQRRSPKAHPRACYQLLRISLSLLLRACKLEWTDSPHDMYISSLSCMLRFHWFIRILGNTCHFFYVLYTSRMRELDYSVMCSGDLPCSESGGE